VPTFRIGARGIDGRLTAIAAAQETRNFRIEHREARVARRDGDLSAAFPFGTYGARVLLNAPVMPVPKDTALVTMPGPLLSDVLDELAEAPRARNDARALANELTDQARNAIVDEAAELASADEMRFDNQATSAPTTEPQAITVHRFGNRRDNMTTRTSRIVTLRDARRGRPRTRHGADPPVQSPTRSRPALRDTALGARACL
jgi:hypothetical protein